MAGDAVSRRLPREGALGTLADAIVRHTGSPGARADTPDLRAALKAAFPELPEPSALGACTTHPALLVQLRVPSLNRSSVKLVLVPKRDGLAARARALVPGGSYRREEPGEGPPVPL